MKNLFLIALVFVSFAGQAQSTTEEAVKKAEMQRFDAQVKKDFAALETLLADDLIYVHSNGNIDNKTSYIQSIRDGKSQYDEIKSEEMRVRVYGKTAVITGVCVVKMPTNPNLRLRYTDVYIKRKGNWQLASWQSLRM
jgi:ketosteroid isomerase-like protein